MTAKYKAVYLILLAFLTACQAPSQSESSIVTIPVVETESVDTSIPLTETPLPTATATVVPTDTPLPTPTLGPVVIKDDFSSQSDIWGNCEKCVWRDGNLKFGLYPPKSGADQIFYVICEACGLHTYYRVAADVTFADGYGDRTFGVLAGLTEKKDFIAAGTVSTLKHALFESFNYSTNQWVEAKFKKFAVVKPGRGTNRIEVEIKPTASDGVADIYVNINGSNVITLLSRPVEPTYTGLYLGWHSVAVLYDNFEFKEIQAE